MGTDPVASPICFLLSRGRLYLCAVNNAMGTDPVASPICFFQSWGRLYLCAVKMVPKGIHPYNQAQLQEAA